MKSNDDVIKSNQQVIEALNEFKKANAVIEVIEVTKPESRAKRVKKRVIENLERMMFNVIDDLPTTLTGIGFSALIIYNKWPDIDTETIIEALGLGSLGAIGTSRSMRFYSKKINQRKEQNEDEQ